MRSPKNVYVKNYSLIVAFLILVTVTLVVAIIMGYRVTAQNVENDFAAKKNNVYEKTVLSYRDFFSNKIPEITSYSGLLDSGSAAKYADSVFSNYNFVRKIVFFQITVGNTSPNKTARNGLGINLKGIYQYDPKGQKVHHPKNEAAINESDFRQMTDNLSDFIANYDTLRGPGPDEPFKTFYNIRPGKISYLNVPNNEDLKVYRELQASGRSKSFYRQNMFAFHIDPQSLKIQNTHPELYQDVSIRQVVYDPPDIDHNSIITDEVSLPGALSDYKLYFLSPRDYLTAEINHRFMPMGIIIFGVYCLFVMIGWLIYRNISVNLKLFKLQYDFINNFTHEFKTPVSVIKIAGSNLKGDNELTDRQRKHYGKILDEEADKLNELMNKLLSFTQLENRSIKIKKDSIKLEPFVKGYIDTFRIKYPQFKLGYHIEGVKTFSTDVVLLGSVFQNLIENAYKYSHPDKKELYINISMDKRNIVFSFADKGIGIPKNEVKNIFKKFYRLENQYNQNGSVGLGLAFCKELVNFLNGDIIVKSKVDQGSEFVVTLPHEN